MIESFKYLNEDFDYWIKNSNKKIDELEKLISDLERCIIIDSDTINDILNTLGNVKMDVELIKKVLQIMIMKLNENDNIIRGVNNG